MAQVLLFLLDQHLANFSHYLSVIKTLAVSWPYPSTFPPCFTCVGFFEAEQHILLLLWKWKNMLGGKPVSWIMGGLSLLRSITSPIILSLPATALRSMGHQALQNAFCFFFWKKNVYSNPRGKTKPFVSFSGNSRTAHDELCCWIKFW
jgi:hypothetical protein